MMFGDPRLVISEFVGTPKMSSGEDISIAPMLNSTVVTGYVRAAIEEPDRCYYRVDCPSLRLLCCDSSVPGRHGGTLGSGQLRWLDAELAEADGDRTPVVLAMHHPPVRSGIAAMDEIMLSDAADLAGVLRRHRPVQRILVGHLIAA